MMDKTPGPGYFSITERLRNVQRRENLAGVLRWTLLSAAFYACIGLLILVIEHFLRTGPIVRTALFWFLHVGIVTLILIKVVPHLLILLGIRPGESDHVTAQRVGLHFPEIRDHLLNAMQLIADDSNKSRYSADLIEAAFRDALHRSEPLDFLRIVDTSRLKKAAVLACGSVVTFGLLFGIFSGSLSGALERVLNYGTSYDAPAPFRLIIEPGDMELVKGDSVTVTVRIEGNLTGPVNLMVRPDRQIDFENVSLEAVSDSLYRYEFQGLGISTTYYAHSGEVRTDEHHLTVLDRPIVRTMRLTITPPAYSGLAVHQAGDHVGDVNALKGTRVHFEVEASKNLSSASLAFDDGSEFPLRVDGIHTVGDLRMMKSKGYRLKLTDESGLENKNPVHYSLNVIPDGAPVIRIQTPGVNLDVAGNENLQMIFNVADDYGLDKVRLGYRLTQSRYEKPADSASWLEVPLPAGIGTGGYVPFTWALETLSLVPEDVITYYAEVFDRDNVSGPNVGRSESYTLRLPSLEEVFASIDEKQESGLEMLKELLSEVAETRNEARKLEEEIRKNPQQPDWEEQKKAEELVQQYEEIQKKIEEATNLIDQMVREMEKNQVVSPETLAKYEELQRLFEELNSDELRDAMKRLQESMREMSPEETMKAMEQLNMTEEQVRQSIERTMNLLKRIQIEQKVDEAIRRMEEMIEEQKELQQQTEQLKKSDNKADAAEAAKAQEELAQKMEQLKEQLNALQKMMEQFPADMPLGELEQALSQMDSTAMAEAMKAISEQMKSMQMSQAASGQQQTMMSMEQLMEQLNAMKTAMQQNMQQEVLNEFRKVYQDLLELSQREEEMKNETGSLQRSSPLFREGQSRQMEAMKDLSNITELLAALSQKTFGVTPEMGKSIGEAMKNMAGAMESMEQRNAQAAAAKQEAAMAALNETAQQVQAGMNAMMQQGGQGMGMPGLMQQLQGMSALQQGINQGTRHLGGMGQRQAAEMARLAGEQGALRKALEQLAREASQAGELSKLLGDLNKTAQEMREVQTDLARGEVQPETIQKQDRILSRLLDSQRSMRERDFEKKRKSETAGQYTREFPPGTDMSSEQAREKLRQDLLKAMEQGYSRDYQSIIKSYFQLLEQSDRPE